MSDLGETLQNILSSSEGIGQLMQAAQQFSPNEKNEESELGKGGALPDFSGLLNGFDSEQIGTILGFIEDYQDESDRRFHMLQALREYAKPEDLSHIEKARQIVKLSKVAKHALHSMRGRQHNV